MIQLKSSMRGLAAVLIIAICANEPILLYPDNFYPKTGRNNQLDFVPPRRTANAHGKSELRAALLEGKNFSNENGPALSVREYSSKKSELRTDLKVSRRSFKTFFVTALAWLGIGLFPASNSAAAQTQTATVQPLTAPMQYPKSYSNPYDPFRFDPLDFINSLSNPFHPLHPINRNITALPQSDRKKLGQILPDELYVQIMGSAYSALPLGLSGRVPAVRDEIFAGELRNYYNEHQTVLGAPRADFLQALLEPPTGQSREFDRNWMRDSLDALQAIMLGYYSAEQIGSSESDRYLATLSLIANRKILNEYQPNPYNQFPYFFEQATARAVKAIYQDPELKSPEAFYYAVALLISVQPNDIDALIKGLYSDDTHINDSSEPPAVSQAEAERILRNLAQTLNQVMQDEAQNEFIRITAGYYLLTQGNYKNQARQFLIEISQTRLLTENRWLALAALITDTEAQESAAQELKLFMKNSSSNPILQISSAAVLARLGHQDAIEFLKEAYQNPDLAPAQRVHAAATLVSLGIDLSETVVLLEQARFLPVFDKTGVVIFNGDIQNLFSSIDGNLLDSKHREILLKSRQFLNMLASNHSNPAIRAMAANRLVMMNLILGSEIGAAVIGLGILASSPYWYPRAKERYDRRERRKKWEKQLGSEYREFLRMFFSGTSELADEIIGSEIPNILNIKHEIRFRNFPLRTQALDSIIKQNRDTSNPASSESLIPVLADEAKYLWNQFWAQGKPSLRAEAYAGLRYIIIAILSFEKTPEERQIFLNRVLPVILMRPVTTARDGYSPASHPAVDEAIYANVIHSLNTAVTTAIDRIDNPRQALSFSDLLSERENTDRDEARSELRRPSSPEDSTATIQFLFNQADQLPSFSNHLLKILLEIFGIHRTQKVPSSEAIVLTNSLIANPDQKETFGLALRKLARATDQAIYVIAPDSVSQMIVAIANQGLDQTIRIRPISDWRELGRLLREKISFAHIIASDEELGGITSVLKRELPDELQNSFVVKSARSSDIASILTAAGLTQTLLEEFQAALRTAYAA